MSRRYEDMFAALDAKGELAWIPFLMLGYPSIEQSVSDIQAMIDSGADALELGIPFSDPVADGPVIQDAARIALESGIKVSDCLAAIKTVRDNNPDIPIGLLVYANLVFKPGIDRFYQIAADNGVDSILIADVPVNEATHFVPFAQSQGIDPVFIAPPNATDESLDTLVEHCRGYTYVVSRPGVTGNHQSVQYPVQILEKLHDKGAPPAVLGFGISNPKHVKDAIGANFKGVISGTAVIRIIHEHGPEAAEHLKQFSAEMKAATVK